jgi:hypothetical protein
MTPTNGILSQYKHIHASSFTSFVHNGTWVLKGFGSNHNVIWEAYHQSEVFDEFELENFEKHVPKFLYRGKIGILGG